MSYIATVRASRGQTTKVRVRGSDRIAAAKELSLPPSRVLSVHFDVWGTIRNKAFSKGPSDSERAVFLLNLAAQTQSKRSVDEVFQQLLKYDSQFQFDSRKLASAFELEDYLDALGFPRNIVLLAKAGRTAGDVEGSLREAANFLLEQHKRKGGVAKQMSGGLAYGLMSLVGIFYGPIAISSQIKDLQNSLGDMLNTNAATDALMAMAAFLQNYGVLLLIAACGLVLVRRWIFPLIRSWPVISTLDRLLRARRAIDFLSTFSLLLRAQRTPADSLKMIAEESPAADRAIYEKLAKVKADGHPLVRGMDPDDWPSSMLPGVSQLEEMSTRDFIDATKAMLLGLTGELDQSTTKLASQIQFLGLMGMVAIILMSVFGLFLPIMTATGGGIM